MTGIVVRPEVFAPEHIPYVLEGREGHVGKLLKCFEPTLVRQRANHAWVCGRTGCGKTATVHSALARHHAKHGVRFVYVNCFKARTAYAVLEQILNDLRVLCAEVPQTEFKARKLMAHIAGKPLIVALDEVDRMPAGDRESILHMLTDMPGVGLVCVSEDKDALAEMPDSTANRLSPILIEMAPVEAPVIKAILADRSEAGLVPGSWSHTILEKVAGMAGGDARVAIQTLRTAAHLADCEGTGFIEERHVTEGFEKSQCIRREYRLRRLSVHHRIIYDVVKERGRVPLREMSAKYMERCISMGMEPASQRSIYRYAEQLRLMRLIRGEKVRAFGGHTQLEAVE